jgi:hypothetical protein
MLDGCGLDGFARDDIGVVLRLDIRDRDRLVLERTMGIGLAGCLLRELALAFGRKC